MKFTDILNERYLTPEQQKEEKRAKTIFKALKKGVVKVPHPRLDEVITFRYHINDNVFYEWEYYMGEKHVIIITSNFTGEGVNIYTDDEKIVDACNIDIESISRNPTGIHLREMIISKIKQRFENWRVPIHIQSNGMKFELDKTEQPINEGYTDDIITDKERKKAKIIYDAFKNGTFTIGGDTKIRYELHNGYDLMMGDYGARIIKLKDEFSSEKRFISVYLIHNDGHETYIDISKANSVYRTVLLRLSEKFKQFDFHITY
jgi:hypothetical protein